METRLTPDEVEKEEGEADVETEYLLDVLGDERSREILEATSRKPRSVEKLSEECGIPSSTIYRRVREMTEEGLLGSDVRYREDGQHVKVYHLSDGVSGLEIGVSASLKLEVSYCEVDGEQGFDGASSD